MIETARAEDLCTKHNLMRCDRGAAFIRVVLQDGADDRAAFRGDFARALINERARVRRTRRSLISMAFFW